MSHICKLFFSVLVLICLCSCKQIFKDLVKETAEESTEKLGKKIGKEIAEEGTEKLGKGTSKEITEQALKQMQWDDIFKLLKKNNPALSNSIELLGKTTRKELGEVIINDPHFYSSLKSSNGIIDKFILFTKDAPFAYKNIDILHWFVNSNGYSKRMGKLSCIDEMILHEQGTTLKFLNKRTNDVLGEFKDGVIKLSSKDKIFNNILLNDNYLIPNSLYKTTKFDGVEFLCKTDGLGRIKIVNAKGISADDFLNQIVYKNKDIDFGTSFNDLNKYIKECSNGNDITAQCIFKYADDGINPKYATIEVDVNGKKFNESFENIGLKKIGQFSPQQNAEILKKYAKKVGLSSEKLSTLLTEMNADNGLAKLIYDDPELNIKRWLNTRNHVDQSKIVKTATGQIPINARTYAGNTFYFNPHLNSKLNARLKSGNNIVNLKTLDPLTYDDLVKLDKMYPDGVPFTKEGFPDFSNIAAKDKNGVPIVMDLGQLSGNSKKDINIAETMFQNAGNAWEDGWTWHHIENSTKLIRVPTIIHQLIDHSGGMSTNVIK